MIFTGKNTGIKSIILLLFVFIIMIILLFRDSFFGFVFQGVDDNISMRSVIVHSLLSGQGYHFIPNYWLGFIFNIPNPDIYNTFLSITGSTRVFEIFITALLLSGFMTFYFLRRMHVSVIGSLFGSICYTFLPHVLSLIYSGHILSIEFIPMLPGFLFCLSVIFDRKKESKITTLLASFWGGIFWAWMMIGEPQRGIYGTVLGFFWILYLIFQRKNVFFYPREERNLQIIKNTVYYFLIILIVGIAIFYPTIEYWMHSEFLSQDGSWDFATSWSFPPSELLDSFAFGYHGLLTGDLHYPYYGDKPLAGNTDSLGFFMLLFAVLGMIFAQKSEKKELYFFSLAGLLTLLLSFGKYFPGSPFFWVWYHIPGMEKLRVPAKFLSMTGFCWSVVGAIGMDTITKFFSIKNSDNKKNQEIILTIIGVLAGISLLWFVTFLFTDGGDSTNIYAVLGKNNKASVDAALTGRLNAVLGMFSLFFIVFLIFLISYKYSKFAQCMPLIFILLSLQNLYISNRFYISRSYVDEKLYYPETPLIKFLKQNLDLSYRASGSIFFPNLTGSPYVMGTVIEQHLYPLNNNDLTYSFPYFDINMFGRIPISRMDKGYYQFFKSAYESIPSYKSHKDIWEMNKSLWYVGNVKYLLIGDEYQKVFLNELAEDAIFVTNVLGSYNYPVSIYELKNKLPRFAFVNDVKPVYDLYLFDELAKSLTNTSKFVLPIEDAGFALTNDNNFSPQQLAVKRVNYNAYEIDVFSERDNIFYFGDLNHKGWKAKLDGAFSQIYRANGIQQYIYIPRGSQKLELYYKYPVVGCRYSKIFILIIFIMTIGYYSLRFIKKTSSDS